MQNANLVNPLAKIEADAAIKWGVRSVDLRAFYEVGGMVLVGKAVEFLTRLVDKHDRVLPDVIEAHPDEPDVDPIIQLVEPDLLILNPGHNLWEMPIHQAMDAITSKAKDNEVKPATVEYAQNAVPEWEGLHDEKAAIALNAPEIRPQDDLEPVRRQSEPRGGLVQPADGLRPIAQGENSSPPAVGVVESPVNELTAAVPPLGSVAKPVPLATVEESKPAKLPPFFGAAAYLAQGGHLASGDKSGIPAMVMPGERIFKPGAKPIDELHQLNAGVATGASNALAGSELVPGTGNTDSVSRVLEPGSFVVRKAAVEAIEGSRNDPVTGRPTMTSDTVPAFFKWPYLAQGGTVCLSTGGDTEKFLTPQAIVSQGTLFGGSNHETAGESPAPQTSGPKTRPGDGAGSGPPSPWQNHTEVAEAAAAKTGVPARLISWMSFNSLATIAEHGFQGSAPAPEPEPPVVPEIKDDEAALVTPGQKIAKDGTVLIKAPAGGAISPVNGEFYKGGWWMPIHGLSPKVEKREPALEPQQGSPPTGSEEGDKPTRTSRTTRAPMSPEDIEEERQKRDRQAKWDEIKASPLGRVKWLGDHPNSKALQNNVTNLEDWKAYAEQLGPEGVKSLIGTLEPMAHAKIDESIAASMAGDDKAKEQAEWERGQIKERANYDLNMYPRKGAAHEKKVPGSFYARQLLQENIGYTKTVEDLHALSKTLPEPKRLASGGPVGSSCFGTAIPHFGHGGEFEEPETEPSIAQEEYDALARLAQEHAAQQKAATPVPAPPSPQTIVSNRPMTGGEKVNQSEFWKKWQDDQEAKHNAAVAEFRRTGKQPSLFADGGEITLAKGTPKALEWVDPPFRVTEGLSAEDAKLEQESQQYARDHYEELKKKYLVDSEQGRYDEHGQLQGVKLGADDWRPLIPGYAGTNAHVVQHASSYLNRRLFAESLQDLRGKGNQKLAVLAGGPGSGKSSSFKQHFAGTADEKQNYPITLDQITDNPEDLAMLAERAESFGFGTDVIFVDRPPEDAWKTGVVDRAVRERQEGKIARTVPLERVVGANISARQAAIGLLQKGLYNTTVIDNSRGRGMSIKIEDRKTGISRLQKQTYDAPELIDRLRNDTLELLESGQLPLDIAAGLVGQRAIDDRRLQPGRSQGRIAGEGVIQRRAASPFEGTPGEGTAYGSPDRGSSSSGARTEEGIDSGPASSITRPTPLEGMDYAHAMQERYHFDAGGQVLDYSDPANTARESRRAAIQQSLRSIQPGNLGHAGSWPVRHVADGQYRVDTDDGFEVADAHTLADRLAGMNEQSARLEGRRYPEAMARASAHQEPDLFGDYDRAMAESAAFDRLPVGSKVVSLEPSTHGRVGAVHLDESGETPVRRVKLDGAPLGQWASNFVEPLEERHSWRVAPKAQEAVKQGMLFADGGEVVTLARGGAAAFQKDIHAGMRIPGVPTLAEIDPDAKQEARDRIENNRFWFEQASKAAASLNDEELYGEDPEGRASDEAAYREEFKDAGNPWQIHRDPETGKYEPKKFADGGEVTLSKGMTPEKSAEMLRAQRRAIYAAKKKEQPADLAVSPIDALAEERERLRVENLGIPGPYTQRDEIKQAEGSIAGMQVENAPAVLEDVLAAMAAQKATNKFQSLTIEQLHGTVGKKHGLGIRQLQAVLLQGKAQKKLGLGPFTQALTQHESPEYLLPADREMKFYVREYADGGEADTPQGDETQPTLPPMMPSVAFEPPVNPPPESVVLGQPLSPGQRSPYYPYDIYQDAPPVEQSSDDPMWERAVEAVASAPFVAIETALKAGAYGLHGIGKIAKRVSTGQWAEGGACYAHDVFAEGGPVRPSSPFIVPGSGNTDSVPLTLQPGDFVVRKAVTQAALPMMGFAGGGSTDFGMGIPAMVMPGELVIPAGTGDVEAAAGLNAGDLSQAPAVFGMHDGGEVGDDPVHLAHGLDKPLTPKGLMRSKYSFLNAMRGINPATAEIPQSLLDAWPSLPSLVARAKAGTAKPGESVGPFRVGGSGEDLRAEQFFYNETETGSGGFAGEDASSWAEGKFRTEMNPVDAMYARAEKEIAEGVPQPPPDLESEFEALRVEHEAKKHGIMLKEEHLARLQDAYDHAVISNTSEAGESDAAAAPALRKPESSGEIGLGGPLQPRGVRAGNAPFSSIAKAKQAVARLIESGAIGSRELEGHLGGHFPELMQQAARVERKNAPPDLDMPDVFREDYVLPESPPPVRPAAVGSGSPPASPPFVTAPASPEPDPGRSPKSKNEQVVGAPPIEFGKGKARVGQALEQEMRRQKEVLGPINLPTSAPEDAARMPVENQPAAQTVTPHYDRATEKPIYQEAKGNEAFQNMRKAVMQANDIKTDPETQDRATMAKHEKAQHTATVRGINRAARGLMGENLYRRNEKGEYISHSETRKDEQGQPEEYTMLVDEMGKVRFSSNEGAKYGPTGQEMGLEFSLGVGRSYGINPGPSQGVEKFMPQGEKKGAGGQTGSTGVVEQPPPSPVSKNPMQVGSGEQPTVSDAAAANPLRFPLPMVQAPAPPEVRHVEPFGPTPGIDPESAEERLERQKAADLRNLAMRAKASPPQKPPGTGGPTTTAGAGDEWDEQRRKDFEKLDPAFQKALINAGKGPPVGKEGAAGEAGTDATGLGGRGGKGGKATATGGIPGSEGDKGDAYWENQRFKGIIGAAGESASKEEDDLIRKIREATSALREQSVAGDQYTAILRDQQGLYVKLAAIQQQRAAAESRAKRELISGERAKTDTFMGMPAYQSGRESALKGIMSAYAAKTESAMTGVARTRLERQTLPSYFFPTMRATPAQQAATGAFAAEARARHEQDYTERRIKFAYDRADMGYAGAGFAAISDSLKGVERTARNTFGMIAGGFLAMAFRGGTAGATMGGYLDILGSTIQRKLHDPAIEAIQAVDWLTKKIDGLTPAQINSAVSIAKWAAGISLGVYALSKLTTGLTGAIGTFASLGRGFGYFASRTMLAGELMPPDASGVRRPAVGGEVVGPSGGGAVMRGIAGTAGMAGMLYGGYQAYQAHQTGNVEERNRGITTAAGGLLLQAGAVMPGGGFSSLLIGAGAATAAYGLFGEKLGIVNAGLIGLVGFAPLAASGVGRLATSMIHGAAASYGMRSAFDAATHSFVTTGGAAESLGGSMWNLVKAHPYVTAGILAAAAAAGVATYAYREMTRGARESEESIRRLNERGNLNLGIRPGVSSEDARRQVEDLERRMRGEPPLAPGQQPAPAQQPAPVPGAGQRPPGVHPQAAAPANVPALTQAEFRDLPPIITSLATSGQGVVARQRIDQLLPSLIRDSQALLNDVNAPGPNGAPSIATQREGHATAISSILGNQDRDQLRETGRVATLFAQHPLAQQMVTAGISPAQMEYEVGSAAALINPMNEQQIRERFRSVGIAQPVTTDPEQIRAALDALNESWATITTAPRTSWGQMSRSALRSDQRTPAAAAALGLLEHTTLPVAQRVFGDREFAAGHVGVADVAEQLAETRNITEARRIVAAAPSILAHGIPQVGGGFLGGPEHRPAPPTPFDTLNRAPESVRQRFRAVSTAQAAGASPQTLATAAQNAALNSIPELQTDLRRRLELVDARDSDRAAQAENNAQIDLLQRQIALLDEIASSGRMPSQPPRPATTAPGGGGVVGAPANRGGDREVNTIRPGGPGEQYAGIAPIWGAANAPGMIAPAMPRFQSQHIQFESMHDFIGVGSMRGPLEQQQFTEEMRGLIDFLARLDAANRAEQIRLTNEIVRSNGGNVIGQR